MFTRFLVTGVLPTARISNIKCVLFFFFQTTGPGAGYEEPKIKAIDIAALLQEKYAFLSGEYLSGCKT